MTNSEKREVLRVGFISLVPRKIWRTEEFIAVGATLAVSALAIIGTSFTGSSMLKTVTDQDAQVVAQRTIISQRVTPLVAMQARLAAAARSSNIIAIQRHSGLMLAKKILTYGDAINHDGVATLLDANGHIEGVAPSFASVSRIWSRLGEKVTLTSARPQDGGVAFTFIAGPNATFTQMMTNGAPQNLPSTPAAFATQVGATK